MDPRWYRVLSLTSTSTEAREQAYRDFIKELDAITYDRFYLRVLGKADGAHFTYAFCVRDRHFDTTAAVLRAADHFLPTPHPGVVFAHVWHTAENAPRAIELTEDSILPSVDEQYWQVGVEEQAVPSESEWSKKALVPGYSWRKPKTSEAKDVGDDKGKKSDAVAAAVPLGELAVSAWGTLGFNVGAPKQYWRILSLWTLDYANINKAYSEFMKHMHPDYKEDMFRARYKEGKSGGHEYSFEVLNLHEQTTAYLKTAALLYEATLPRDAPLVCVFSYWRDPHGLAAEAISRVINYWPAPTYPGWQLGVPVVEPADASVVVRNPEAAPSYCIFSLRSSWYDAVESAWIALRAFMPTYKEWDTFRLHKHLRGNEHVYALCARDRENGTIIMITEAVRQYLLTGPPVELWLHWQSKKERLPMAQRLDQEGQRIIPLVDTETNDIGVFEYDDDGGAPVPKSGSDIRKYVIPAEPGYLIDPKLSASDKEFEQIRIASFKEYLRDKMGWKDWDWDAARTNPGKAYWCMCQWPYATWRALPCKHDALCDACYGDYISDPVTCETCPKCASKVTSFEPIAEPGPEYIKEQKAAAIASFPMAEQTRTEEMLDVLDDADMDVELWSDDEDVYVYDEKAAEEKAMHDTAAATGEDEYDDEKGVYE